MGIRRAIESWRAEIRETISRGELLEAYDLAERALEDFPEDPILKYTAVLVLARAGATKQARARYNAFGLKEQVVPADPALQLDVATLEARIAKDEAFAARDCARSRLLADAAARYGAIFRNTGDYYPGINAATLSLLGGDTERAESLAKEVLKACDRSGTNSYYRCATQAEAALILSDIESAKSSLAKAAASYGGDRSAVATTRRQLKLVCAARRIPIDVLDSLRPPTVIHYSGHRIGPRLALPQVEAVRLQIRSILEKLDVGFGYGSLAAGSDIVFAEELLSRGAEINLTMPFEIEEFKQVSVAPAGSDWLARFDACFGAAKSVTFATTDEYLGDDSLFGYAGRMAMGLALLRAQFLDSEAHQIAVWDGGPAGGDGHSAGTALDVALWQSQGLPREIIDPGAQPSPGTETPSANQPPESAAAKIRDAAPEGGRAIRAMLFADAKGFSKLREAQLPLFVREVLGRLAKVLNRHESKILFRNTWGDGLYVVTADVETAAQCAMELQDEILSFDPTAHGLPQSMGLRLGAHLGPVFHIVDPVLKRPNFIGAHVSRAARIEPVTPEGEVYVTEAFAAALAINRRSGFACEYIGQIPAAKHYGTMRMYALRRATVA